MHATGRYGKKIRGRTHYFGTDQDAALAEWLRVKVDLIAGRTPNPVNADGCDLATLCNHFLTNAKSKRDRGELTNRLFNDYHKSCERILNHLGKTAPVEEIRPDDLMRLRRALAKTLNPNSLGNEVGRIRVILRFAFENGLTAIPLRFGDFKRPVIHVLRRARAQSGTRLFEAIVISQLLEGAEVQMKAMILFGVNCGFGNADWASSPQRLSTWMRGGSTFLARRRKLVVAAPLIQSYPQLPKVIGNHVEELQRIQAMLPNCMLHLEH